ncbi:MAG: twin-arginine translocase subunit TatC, partial [Leptonema sp. (in: Bacteria)]|nr:twin-arginine translocase subunit TatC [Leptonema sp. (in: bacteria)]
MAVSKKKTTKKKATTTAKSQQRKRQSSVMPTGHTKRQLTTSYTEAEKSLFEEHDRDKYMSIGDHLEELRRRLLWIIAIVLIASSVAGYFIEEIHGFMIEPYSEVAKRVSIERGSPGADKLILGSVYGPFQ